MSSRSTSTSNGRKSPIRNTAAYTGSCAVNSFNGKQYPRRSLAADRFEELSGNGESSGLQRNNFSTSTRNNSMRDNNRYYDSYDHGYNRYDHGYNRYDHGYNRYDHGYNRYDHGYNRYDHGYNGSYNGDDDYENYNSSHNTNDRLENKSYDVATVDNGSYSIGRDKYYDRGYKNSADSVEYLNSEEVESIIEAAKSAGVSDQVIRDSIAAALDNVKDTPGSYDRGYGKCSMR